MKSDNRMILTVLCSGILMFSALASHAFDLPDLLPVDDEVAGWSRDGDYQYPQDADSLRGVINGAADLFLRHDFRGAVFQNYIDSAQTGLSLQIFDQTYPEQAEAIYDSTSLGGETPLQDPGEEARELELLFTYQIEFWRSCYYVKGAVQSKEQAYKNALMEFMMLVDEKILQVPVQGRSRSWGSIKADRR